MFDKKDDYALNKLNPDVIVCKNATGVHIRLTRADFASEEEFLRWRDWSDKSCREIDGLTPAIQNIPAACPNGAVLSNRRKQL